MPIGGHPPGVDHAFELQICPPCRAGDHVSCRPPHGRWACECIGVAMPSLTVLPCLPIKEP